MAVRSGASTALAPAEVLPKIVRHAGRPAEIAWRDFFSGKLPNDGTRAAYRNAVCRFLHSCERRGVVDLSRVTPGDLGDYFRAHPGALPTKKQHLSAIRKFFNLLVERHLCLLNPASATSLERYTVVEGKTPEITQTEVDRLVRSIGTQTVVRLRDRAIIAVLTFTGVRAGAVSKLCLEDFYEVGGQWMLHFDEKRGKSREIPVRHDLQLILCAYLDAAGLRDAPKESPLFRSAIRRENRLTERGMSGNDICRMLKRRMRAAGISEKLSAHSFRVAVATDLFAQGVETGDIQYLLGHSDPRTTRLYDRTPKKVTRNLVERIRISIADS